MTPPPAPYPYWSQPLLGVREQVDRSAWVNECAMRWGLIRDPRVLTPWQARKTSEMARVRMAGHVYPPPCALDTGDLYQLAELMPYLIDPDKLPKVTPSAALYRQREATERCLFAGADDRFED